MPAETKAKQDNVLQKSKAYMQQIALIFCYFVANCDRYIFISPILIREEISHFFALTMNLIAQLILWLSPEYLLNLVSDL